MKNKPNDIRHELLSELHYLLSIASADDFIAASKLCKSENIKLALEALAEEHTGNRMDAIPVERVIKNLSSRAPKLKQNPDSNGNDIQNLLLDKSHFAKKQDLIEFAKLNGIAISVGEKESRERVALKLLKFINKTSPAKQQATRDKLFEGFDSQTAGWARVIKRPS